MHPFGANDDTGVGFLNCLLGVNGTQKLNLNHSVFRFPEPSSKLIDP